MRRLVLGLLMIAFVLSRCAGSDPKPGPPSSSSTSASSASAAAETCPSDELRRQAYADSEVFFEDRMLVDVPGTIRLEGTLEGEVGTFLIAADPDARSLRVSGP